MEEEWDQPNRNRKSIEVFSPSFEPTYTPSSVSKDPIEEEEEGVDIEGI
jgi:hypothetical protein